MSDFIIPLRWIHVLAASIWLGEVVVINFIMIPLVSKSNFEDKKQIISNIFTKLFRMASILSLTTVVSGILLMGLYTNWDLTLLTEGRWGISILLGGIFASGLTLFHFFLEHKVTFLLSNEDREILNNNYALVYSRLKIIPRIGLVVISSIYLLMMFAVRGI